MTKRGLPLSERMDLYTIKGDGCWLWIGARGSEGYGRIGLPRTKRVILSHRAAWQLAYGPIPDGLWVLHHCDNRRCVRPDHLFLGTHTDNMRDCSAKGRHAGQKMTHCKRGHAFVPENFYLHRQNGRISRVCRSCERARQRARYGQMVARNRAKQAS